MLARLGSAPCRASSAVRTPMIVTTTIPSICTGRQQQRTLAAVKELSWCAPSDSPNKSKKHSALQQKNTQLRDEPQMALVPIRRFGIVGAMSRNRVIGIDGKLPWTCPEDRRMFVDLTRDKILIVGRKTFQEKANGSHVSHTAHCIVVSKTLAPVELLGAAHRPLDSRPHRVPKIHVVPCLDTALDLARQLVVHESGQDASANASEEEDSITTTTPSGDGTTIECWIGGGERIFDEALVHPSAFRLNLTIIDTDVPLEGRDMSTVARFPPKYRWDHNYRPVSTTRAIANCSGSLNFTHCIYERIQGSRSR